MQEACQTAKRRLGRKTNRSRASGLSWCKIFCHRRREVEKKLTPRDLVCSPIRQRRNHSFFAARSPAFATKALSQPGWIAYTSASARERVLALIELRFRLRWAALGRFTAFAVP